MQIMAKSPQLSYFRDTDEHTKVFISKIEELGLCIQKSKAIIKGKL